MKREGKDFELIDAIYDGSRITQHVAENMRRIAVSANMLGMEKLADDLCDYSILVVDAVKKISQKHSEMLNEKAGGSK